MKMVCRCGELLEAQRIQHLMESHGIPAHISGQDSFHHLQPLTSEALSIWVYLDEQFPDAQALLADPQHRVQNPVDVDHFYTTLKQALPEEKLSKFNYSLFLNGVTVALLLILAGIVIHFSTRANS